MRRRDLSIAAGLAIFLGHVAAAGQAGVRSRVVTVTRLVKIFLDLESHLLELLEQKDRGALDAMLSDSFEMRMAASPGVPIPRAAWLDAAVGADAPAVSSYMIEQMAVYELGSNAIVSFLLQPPVRAGKGGGSPPVFVVDTWEQAQDRWRLKLRFAAPRPSKAPRVSGEATVETIPKKY